MEINLHPLFSKIEKLLPHIENKTACFDADGTLWPEDVDLSFLDHQIQNHYPIVHETVTQARKMFQKDHTKACSLLAQRHHNVPFDQLQIWCKEFFQKNPLTIFPFQKKLLSFLKEHNITLYVVSASPQFIVQAAVQHYDLPIDHVIGVQTLVKDNIMTDEIQFPISVGPGKVDTFLNKSKQEHPFFVSGNTLSDLKLLELSTHLKLTVASAKKQERHYDTERQLLSIAQKNSWLYIDLIDQKTNLI